MHLNDVNDIDPMSEEIVVLFNARPDEITFSEAAFTDKDFVLHSVQQSSADERVRGSSFDISSGTFTIPGRTTAVFNILDELPPEPTPTATQAAPAMADTTVLLTLAGVIGGFVAVVAMMLALRRRDH
jgi:hypothetical protein